MKKDVREQFGRVAHEYLTSKAHDRPDELRALVARVSPVGGRMLDVGTGAGHTAYAFAGSVDEVVATDVTQEMLDLVAEESARRGMTNIRVEHAEAESLPFSDGTFDGVGCRVAAHHFSDVGAFVRESYRVLRSPGWFLLVDTVSPEDAAGAAEVNEIESMRDPSHVRNLAVSEWLGLIDGAGFVVEWSEESAKRLNFTDWVKRMRVPDEVVPEVRARISQSKGVVRAYFDPSDDEFSLRQVSIVARKR